VRTLKQGMQDLAGELQVNIGFMFKQQGAFDTGIAALQASDPPLAEYLRHTRAWSERLIESRNAIEHKGWTLPRIEYTQTGIIVAATEPMISGQPVTEFVKLMLDRLCCFVEEFTVHALQRHNAAANHVYGTPSVDAPRGSAGEIPGHLHGRWSSGMAACLSRRFL
jgi:hypothetical protein